MATVCTAVYEDIVKKYGKTDKIIIKEPADVLQVRKVAYLSKQEKEHVIVLLLSGSGEVSKVCDVTIGLLNHSLVHPREVFRDAIKNNAHSIICVHNHPSGNLEPSKADIDVSIQLKTSGDIIGIELLDHIIVSKLGIQSIRQMGYL